MAKVLGTDRKSATHVKQSSPDSPSGIGPIKKGGFHRYLGKKAGEPITAADIAKGKASPSTHVQKMAVFAQNAKKWKH